MANPVVPRASADDRCLANAIYYEARGEPLRGRRAVLEVIQHRMIDTGKTACAIIREPQQFSWFRHKPLMPMTYELLEMLTEVKQADKVLNNEKYKNFHSGKSPSWARKMLCRKISNHTFCKPKEKQQ
jgi:spore germination cell wall hydrolase CwlJ-like protein